MEFFFLFSWIFVVAITAAAKSSGGRSKSYSTVPEYAAEEKMPNFDFEHAADPHSYFSEQERILLRDIADNEDKKKKAIGILENVEIQGEIIDLKKTLTALRSQYRDFCAKYKYANGFNEKEVERHNDIVFNFRECFNPHEYFSTQERILLRDIDAKEDKMNTNSTLFEAFLLSKDIDKQKRTLSALRSQYRDFCAKCK